MGQTCRNCSHSGREQEIKTDKSRAADASAMQSRVDSSARCSKAIEISPADTLQPAGKSVANKQNETDFSFAENKKPLKTKKDGLVMSTARINGVKKDSLPDYFNPITKKKHESLASFEYSKPKYEKNTASYQTAIDFDGKMAYEGQWKNNIRCGRGRQIWKDGSFYEGYWLDNTANGFGRYIAVNGDFYEGEWTRGHPHGYGVYEHAETGVVYKGNWKNDREEGEGEEVWPNGVSYKGSYLNGKKHGMGLYNWPDGCTYSGMMQDNNIQGTGKFTWKDGRFYEGQWKDNKKEGKGIFKWPDGRTYQGQYKNDLKHGKGMFTWTDGRVYEGEWESGHINGRGQLRNRSALLKQGIWVNGVLSSTNIADSSQQ